MNFVLRIVRGGVRWGGVGEEIRWPDNTSGETFTTECHLARVAGQLGMGWGEGRVHHEALLLLHHLLHLLLPSSAIELMADGVVGVLEVRRELEDSCHRFPGSLPPHLPNLGDAGDGGELTVGFGEGDGWDGGEGEEGGEGRGAGLVCECGGQGGGRG